MQSKEQRKAEVQEKMLAKFTKKEQEIIRKIDDKIKKLQKEKLRLYKKDEWRRRRRAKTQELADNVSKMKDATGMTIEEMAGYFKITEVEMGNIVYRGIIRKTLRWKISRYFNAWNKGKEI